MRWSSLGDSSNFLMGMLLQELHNCEDVGLLGIWVLGTPFAKWVAKSGILPSSASAYPKLYKRQGGVLCHQFIERCDPLYLGPLTFCNYQEDAISYLFSREACSIMVRFTYKLQSPSRRGQPLVQ
jgi:hypothetical protein